jgi:hypothetical protein
VFGAVSEGATEKINIYFDMRPISNRKYDYLQSLLNKTHPNCNSSFTADRNLNNNDFKSVVLLSYIHNKSLGFRVC